MPDIVIDNSVMLLYGPKCPTEYMELFSWLDQHGTLTVSQKLIAEYHRSNARNLGPVINRLTMSGRLIKKSKGEIASFNSRHYRFTCNGEDVPHAIVVFISSRKKLVSKDNRLRADVNNHPLVDGIKPTAEEYPVLAYYA